MATHSYAEGAVEVNSLHRKRPYGHPVRPFKDLTEYPPCRKISDVESPGRSVAEKKDGAIVRSKSSTELSIERSKASSRMAKLISSSKIPSSIQYFIYASSIRFPASFPKGSRDRIFSPSC